MGGSGRVGEGGWGVFGGECGDGEEGGGLGVEGG